METHVKVTSYIRLVDAIISNTKNHHVREFAGMIRDGLRARYERDVYWNYVAPHESATIPISEVRETMLLLAAMKTLTDEPG